MVFFKIGHYIPIPKKRLNDNVINSEDNKFVRIFMKDQETEPGYTCHHRSTPVYMADPSVTFVSLHNQ